jgi:hypothetical protein
MIYRKLFENITDEEKEEVNGEYYICFHELKYVPITGIYYPYFQNLVVYRDEFVARFIELSDAENYIEYMNGNL